MLLNSCSSSGQQDRIGGHTHWVPQIKYLDDNCDDPVLGWRGCVYVRTGNGFLKVTAALPRQISRPRFPRLPWFFQVFLVFPPNRVLFIERLGDDGACHRAPHDRLAKIILSQRISHFTFSGHVWWGAVGTEKLCQQVLLGWKENKSGQECLTGVRKHRNSRAANTKTKL